MMNSFLEREKELLQLNATLNSKCGSLNDEKIKQMPEAKSKSNKRSKSINRNGNKSKLIKSTTQSIKLKMSYEKIDVKSFYDDLSKSILRLDLNASQTNNTKVEIEDTKSIETESENTSSDGGSCGGCEQDISKWHNDTLPSEQFEMNSMNGNSMTVTNKKMASTNRSNRIETFLNEFTVDPQKLNIDPPTNAVGDLRNANAKCRTLSMDNLTKCK